MELVGNKAKDFVVARVPRAQPTRLPLQELIASAIVSRQ